MCCMYVVSLSLMCWVCMCTSVVEGEAIMKAAYKDIGEMVAEYVAVVLDDSNDQVWQSDERYQSKDKAIEAAHIYKAENKRMAKNCTDEVPDNVE